jgi:hypothetical protein
MAYLQTKGKDKATNDNFEKILKQLEDTTNLTKGIETHITKKELAYSATMGFSKGILYQASPSSFGTQEIIV